jgi:outer membrane protein assembly factor BamB
MEIRIDCVCGTPYEFEVEPVDGLMPCTIACPTCGADGTEQANLVIQQQLPAMTISDESLEERPLPEFCHRHATQPAVDFCRSCKQPICEICRRNFGYFCSPYCRQKAKDSGMDIPQYANQEAVAVGREYQRLKAFSASVAFLLVALAGVWVWYEAYACKPHLAVSLPVTGRRGITASRFIAPNRAVLLADQTLSTIDTGAGRQIWSMPLPVGVQDEDKPQASRDGVQPKWGMAGGKLWVVSAAGVVACNPDTGRQEKSVAIKGLISGAQIAGDSALLLSREPDNQWLTLVDLTTGQSRAEVISSPLRRVIEKRPPRPQPVDLDADASESGPAEPQLYAERDEIVPAGKSAILMNARLVAKKFAVVQTIKSQETGALDRGNLGVNDTMDVTQDAINDAARRRTGGVRVEDISRYSVRLHRWFVSGAVDWNGEVTGAPGLFSLPSVDLLVAGRSLIAFDRKNTRLWEAQLAYPIDTNFDESSSSSVLLRDSSAAPAIEHSGSIYFFDRGILTAFDEATGAVRWRLPSVGISHVQLDDQGLLYVATTSRSQESIQYSDQVNLRDRPFGVILKIDPGSGRIVWRLENIADDFYVAGKYLYGIRPRILNRATSIDPVANFQMVRLNPRNGDVLWTYPHLTGPITLEFQGRTILWLAQDELRILRFLSL